MSRNRVREAASLRIEISGLRQYAAEPTRPGDIVVLYVRSSATTSSVHLLHPSPLFASCDGWRKEEARLVVVARGLIEKRAK